MPSSHGTRRKSRSILTKDNKITGVSYLLIEYKPGDKVVFSAGPLRDLIGIFEREVKGSERSMILLSAIGYQRPSCG